MKLTHIINDKVINTHKNIELINKENSKKYEFMLDNILNSIYITDRLIFKRKSDEYEFLLQIGKKSCCTLKLIQENKEFDINIKFAEYEINENEINISYELDMDNDEKHFIKLEIEE